MPDRPIPTAPRGLSIAGSTLWQSIHAGLPEEGELDDRETAILALACRQADDVAHLEDALARDGLVVQGSAGQPRLSAVLAELRQGRIAVARLLGDLSLVHENPLAGASPRTAASLRAKHAADTRWGAHRDELAAKRRGA